MKYFIFCTKKGTYLKANSRSEFTSKICNAYKFNSYEEAAHVIDYMEGELLLSSYTYGFKIVCEEE